MDERRSPKPSLRCLREKSKQAESAEKQEGEVTQVRLVKEWVVNLHYVPLDSVVGNFQHWEVR